MKDQISPYIHAVKNILETLNVGELRLIEDYAQHLRINLQDENLKKLRGEQ